MMIILDILFLICFMIMAIACFIEPKEHTPNWLVGILALAIIIDILDRLIN